MSATVYIAHIGENDGDKVLDIASRLGTPVSHQSPQRSRKAKGETYWARGAKRTGLPDRYSYFMMVTMETPEEARALVDRIGSKPWDNDWDYGLNTIDLVSIPLMYAELSYKR